MNSFILIDDSADCDGGMSCCKGIPLLNVNALDLITFSLRILISSRPVMKFPAKGVETDMIPIPWNNPDPSNVIKL